MMQHTAEGCNAGAGANKEMLFIVRFRQYKNTLGTT
jgi:hypothetical protein